MNLQTLLNKIAHVGIAQKTINCSASGASIYALNPETVKDYGLLFATPTGSHEYTENVTRYTITLFYLDRLVESSTNDINIFSAGIETLKNIIMTLRNDPEIVEIGDRINFINFTETERLSDRCAGAYCEVQITVINDTICAE